MTTKVRGMTPPRRAGALLTAALLSTALAGAVLWWSTLGEAGTTAGRLGGDFHALRALPGGRLLYGQHAGVSASLDGGRTWGPFVGGGDAMALAASPRAPAVLVLAGNDVLRVSRDGGQSWQDQGFGNLPGTDVHGFAVAPDLPNVWYANLSGRGLYRSENGRDWRLVSPATGGTMALAVGPGSVPRLYALTMDAGLIVSDNGTIWQRAGDAPQAASSGLDVHPVSGHVYLAGPAGVARSEDKGASWTNLDLPEGARLITADPGDETKLYAAGESGAVYRSADGGRSWSR
ncbi:WD40/YVTN/BNR-like repeat-containing protein [Deinococcus aetherius]|nr:sialidase family protein [Deinococcus aetherius]